MKVVLDNVASLSNPQTAITTINNNNDTIEEGFENTLSRDGSTPNQMAASLDMNSNRILNLPRPQLLQEPLRLEDLNDFVGGTLTVVDRTIEESLGIYDAENNSIANFVSDGVTDNTPIWNTFMLAVKNGSIPANSTLRFVRRGPSYYRFASRPRQMASSLKLEGATPNAMFLLRDYQPGQVLLVNGTLQDSSKGTTVNVHGPLVIGHNVAITFGTPSISINKLIGPSDNPEIVARFYVDQINGNVTLAAAGIFARQAYVGPETFTIVHPAGDPVITKTDPDSNITYSDPISVTLTTNPVDLVAVDQIVGVFNIGGTGTANGTFYAGYIAANKVLLIGSSYSGVYSGGGGLLTAPLEPFIELGPQSVTDEYAINQTVDKILVYAGGGTVGGIGFDVGSHPVGSTVQGSSYRPILKDIQVFVSTGGFWWVPFRIDGSQSYPDPGFEGARDVIVTGLFVSGNGTLYTLCWLRGIGSGTFEDFHIVDFGTSIAPGLIVDGTNFTKSYTMNITAPTVGNIQWGPYVNDNVLVTGGIGHLNMINESGVSSNVFVTGGVTSAPNVIGTANRLIAGPYQYMNGDSFNATLGTGFDFLSGGTSRFTISSSGAVSNKGTTALFPNITTTVSAANAFLDSGASNSLLRSTSLSKYKTNLRKLDTDYAYDVIDRLCPVTYNSLAEADDKERTFIGMIAEDVHDNTAIDGKSPIVQYAENKPDGLMYDRVSLYLIPIVKDLTKQIQELKRIQNNDFSKSN